MLVEFAFRRGRSPDRPARYSDFFRIRPGEKVKHSVSRPADEGISPYGAGGKPHNAQYVVLACNAERDRLNEHSLRRRGSLSSR